MKPHWLFAIVFLFAWNCLVGEIKNGYEPEILTIRESLKGLNKLLDTDSSLSLFQKAEIKTKIDKLVEYLTYSELTEVLLLQFRSIAPGLYHQIDTIKNCTRQSVTVFVKFVPEKEMRYGAAATTNLAYHEKDKNVYLSRYGPHTVSVKIASVKKSLLLLAHELGHVKYQVPNLSSYIDYHTANYQNETFKSTYIGHNSNDPSGQKALEFENIFRNQYVNFIRNTSTKADHPSALLRESEKLLVKKEGYYDQLMGDSLLYAWSFRN